MMQSLPCSALRVLTWAVLVLNFLVPGWSFAQPARIKALEGKDIPTVIKSDTLEIDNKRRVVTFMGNVEASRGDMVIRSNKLLVHYRDGGTQKTAEQKGFKLDRIVASGDVRILRAEGGVATSEQAVYYQDTEKVVLTGKPMVKQGEDFVEGGVITLFLNEDRSVVESADDQKVRAVLSPRSVRK